MRTAFAILLIIHGFAHLPGFLAAWRLGRVEGLPHKTTLMGGRIDIGEAGARVAGTIWFALAVAFGVAGVALLAGLSWWSAAVICITIISLILTLLNLPEARVGMVLDVAILAFLAMSSAAGWF